MKKLKELESFKGSKISEASMKEVFGGRTRFYKLYGGRPAKFIDSRGVITKIKINEKYSSKL